MNTPKRQAESPLESDLQKRVHKLSPGSKYESIDYNIAMKVIETFPSSLAQSVDLPKQNTELHEEDSELIKSLCSSRVKEMFSLMINEALMKIMPDVKDRVEQLETVSRDHNDEIIKLRDHVNSLTEDVTSFQLQLDAQEQWHRDHNIRISNTWPESGDDDLLLKTVDLFKSIDATITESDIDIVHRIGKPRDSPRPVIVRMLRKRQKDVIMREKKNLKNNNLTLNTAIFLNDDLTRFRDNILYEARQLKKQHKIKNAFSLGGNIYVIQNNDRRLQIVNPKQLLNYLT